MLQVVTFLLMFFSMFLDLILYISMAKIIP